MAGVAKAIASRSSLDDPPQIESEWRFSQATAIRAMAESIHPVLHELL